MTHRRVHVTPVTDDPDVAEDWFRRFEGAGFDGVMAKPGRRRLPAGQAHDAQGQAPAHGRLRGRRVPLAQGRRGHRVAAARAVRRRGRPAPRGRGHVVHRRRRKELVDEVAPLREDALDGHPWAWAWAEARPTRQPAHARRPSRWNATKDLSWEPLRPERVVEVRYEHPAGGRFRHACRFVRWRDDKTPAECTYDQLEAVAPAELSTIFGTAPAGCPDGNGRRRNLTRRSRRGALVRPGSLPAYDPAREVPMTDTADRTTTSGDPVAEVKDWLADNWDPDLTVAEWWERLGDLGVGRAHLAVRLVRQGPEPRRGRARSSRPSPSSAPSPPPGPGPHAGRSHHRRARHRRAEAALPARHRHRAEGPGASSSASRAPAPTWPA